MLELHDLIRRRFSPRAFSPRPVSPEVLATVLEAARWAASCFNEQPWRFIVATSAEPDQHARLAGVINDKNRRWAGRAPVLLIAVAKKTFSRNGKPNRHALHDVGLAVGNLSLQATALGLSLHQLAGFDPDAARAVFSIPDDFEPVTAIALGYRGDPSELPDGVQERDPNARERRPLDEQVFAGEWGRPAPLSRDD